MAWTCYNTRWADVRADSDADYQALGKWVSDRLTDLGWGKTADTGQIDWSSATRPGAPSANTAGGYEIRVSSGPATDLYLKISYGLGYSTATMGFWIMTGEGSDGAGTLTGDTATSRQVGSGLGSVTPYESSWYLAGDADNFVFGATNENNAANGTIFGVQRTCDASGVDTNTGWWQYGIGYTSALFSKCQYVAYTGGAATTDDNTLGILHVQRTLGGTGRGILFLPIFGQDGSSFIALRDVMGQQWGNLYAVNSLTHYGSSRTYLSCEGSPTASWWGQTHPATVYVGVRIA